MDWEERNKNVFFFRWHDCVENSRVDKKKKKKILELINDYSKVVEYKDNIQKSQIHSYISAVNKWKLKLKTY